VNGTNPLLLFFATLFMFLMFAPWLGGLFGWFYALSKNRNGPETLKTILRGCLKGILFALVSAFLITMFTMFVG
jgi:RsiW-degrading membrane proteinase PrsW (M82 family)